MVAVAILAVVAVVVIVVWVVVLTHRARPDRPLSASAEPFTSHSKYIAPGFRPVAVSG